MREVPDDYFQKGPFRRKGPFGFRTYTCGECHQRTYSLADFRAHRAVCLGQKRPGSLARWALDTDGGTGERRGVLEPEDIETLAALLRDWEESG